MASRLISPVSVISEHWRTESSIDCPLSFLSSDWNYQLLGLHEWGARGPDRGRVYSESSPNPSWAEQPFWQRYGVLYGKM